ncbi:protein MAIN-LIKE 1-like [Papaver somniferum]|uniref:protein MAIN-LIKE 1-like n=1 Tax=Papaver somniferum TaxID=3469 RepID=UPI000E6F8356|nr:protein MAIN-LIKE 1-like [Papaver somniferum]
MVTYKIDSTTEYINNIDDWKPSKAVLHYVKGMGLEFLHQENDRGLKFPIHRSFQLLNELLWFYNKEDKVFFFNDIKLSYGLQDVFYLTGLPINGKRVSGEVFDAREQFERIFGYKPLKGDAIMDVNGNINLSALKKLYRNIGNDSVELTEEVRQHICAYMLYHLHCFVVPELDGKASTRYLPLLSDVTNIHQYAWGAASLANLHAELACIQEKQFKAHGNPKKPDELQFRSQLYPLLLFFFEHIPKLLTVVAINKPEWSLPMKFPLMAEWSHIMLKSFLKHGWYGMPYQRLENNFIPSDYRELGKFAATRTILHFFEKCSYHRPDLAPKQFGIINVDETKLKDMIEIHTCSRKGPRVKNFLDYTANNCNYPAMGLVWEERMHSDLRHQSPMEAENEEDEDQGTAQSTDNVDRVWNDSMELENEQDNPVESELGNEQGLNGIRMPERSCQSLVGAENADQDDDDDYDGNLILDNPESTIWYFI